MTEYEYRLYSQGQHANQNWVNSKSINGIKNYIYLQAKPFRGVWLSRGKWIWSNNLVERGAKFLTQIWLLIEQRVKTVGLVEEII
ncbi:hypothetical protein TSUD_227360 [Trifolium subterraneum]|uniref:Uncharacterized protein n=1 Tax=Trifolium subterraneum TaxID=3900 RepID=A0A2Z6NST8_TRISU|nr:hypothetical protein TSUD_227360 [Trifolium subterraneum]